MLGDERAAGGPHPPVPNPPVLIPEVGWVKDAPRRDVDRAPRAATSPALVRRLRPWRLLVLAVGGFYLLMSCAAVGLFVLNFRSMGTQGPVLASITLGGLAASYVAVRAAVRLGAEPERASHWGRWIQGAAAGGVAVSLALGSLFVLGAVPSAALGLMVFSATVWGPVAIFLSGSRVRGTVRRHKAPPRGAKPVEPGSGDP